MGRVVAVAHFPPPLHGMSATVERLVSDLERTSEVRRVTVSAPSLTRSPTYHVVRIARALRALVVLVAERRRSTTAFFSCDGGLGLVYTGLLTATARALGYEVLLQHHSYAYITHRSRPLAAVVRVLDGHGTHLVTCPRMAEDLRARYPRARTRVVGIARSIPLAPAASRRPRGERMVLGFLGNVTLDKGIDVAVDTARAMGRAGVPVELRVAGPVVDDGARRLLDDAGQDLAVTAVGPVGGAGRDAFLDDLDAFLFPSRHVHESFGLVAWEAMGRGVPLLALRAGCLTADAVGAGGLVLDAERDFVAEATALLRHWWADEASWSAACAAARDAVVAVVADSEREVEDLSLDLAVLTPHRS